MADSVMVMASHRHNFSMQTVELHIFKFISEHFDVQDKSMKQYGDSGKQ